MRIEESCGCGASLTFDYGDDEPPTVIDLQGIVDEFRHAHAQCRTDERARIVAEGYSRPSVELEAPWVWGTTETTDSTGVPWSAPDEKGETAVGPPIAPPEPPTPGDILRATRLDRLRRALAEGETVMPIEHSFTNVSREWLDELKAAAADVVGHGDTTAAPGNT